MPEIEYEEAVPRPEYLIKSIAEQGYSLETALADLIDNSVSANAEKVEILTENHENKLIVYLADNGGGMTEQELIRNMQFPSNDMDHIREENDLGRFGLGMKTASFSQTRKFTVITRKKGEEIFSARTWDVDYLKKCGKWRIKKNTNDEIKSLFSEYESSSKKHLAAYSEYTPNTIIVWEGLYKFENYTYTGNQFRHFKEQLNNVTSEYLGIVFHKFMELKKNPLQIRINNTLVKPFNPFCSSTGEIPRSLGLKEMRFGKDVLKMNAFILPVKACDNQHKWTTKNHNLMDLEGLYIYRGNRIIFYGGWNNIIKKESKLRLARLKIQVGNLNDDKLQLNVSKSQISIPYDLKTGVLKYIIQLREEAKKEYNNRGVKKKNGYSSKNNAELLSRIVTTKGAIYEINKEYPLVKLIWVELNTIQKKSFDLFIRSLNLILNKQRHSEKDYIIFTENKDPKHTDKVIKVVEKLLKTGFSSDQIFSVLLNDLGYNENNLTEDLKNILDKNKI